MKRTLLLILTIGAFVATGCAGRRSASSSDALLIKYLHEDSQTNLVNLSKAYGSRLSRVVREDRPQPGECADYAVTLALLNHAAEANTWFNLEVHYYPTSAQYVEQLKLDLIPQYASDNSTDAREADLSGYGSEESASSSEGTQVAGGSESAPAPKVKLTKKEKKKLARQKAKAKKQARREKEKAKKAKIKAKKKAKKQAAKQKAQAQKESRRNEE